MKTKIPEINTTRFNALIAISMIISTTNCLAAEEPQIPANTTTQLFAQVGDRTITRKDLEIATARAFRKRFYHARPPAEQLEQLRKKVAEDLIMRVLLLEEASRRGIQPDHKYIEASLARYEKRYSKSPRWKTEGAEMLSSLRVYLEDEDRLKQLETRIRAIEPPTQEQLLTYYRANPDKFTEPPRQRVSVILLRVDPSSPREVWDAALKEGQDLFNRLQQGADFSELARLHSGDTSANNGGDMGYLHKGMLSPQAEAKIAQLQVDEHSSPMRLLEGVAIFRLTARSPARLRAFADVRERCEALWIKERADNAWRGFTSGLRESTPVEIFDPSFTGSVGTPPEAQIVGSSNSSSN